MHALVREREIRKLYWAPLEVSESHTVSVTFLGKSDEMNLLGIDLSSFWATQDFFVSTLLSLQIKALGLPAHLQCPTAFYLFSSKLSTFFQGRV